MKKVLFICFVALILSCADDNYIDVPDDLLEDTIVELYGSLDPLILPESDDYTRIPNDPLNPLSSNKVELGKLLFHETASGTDPTKEVGFQTYSCASCHHAKASFQSGRIQGIGEGGWGFGTFGESRTLSPDYQEDEIDVQPIRTPTVLNAAFQEVMLWNGQFGATGVNTGTESEWTTGTPKEKNFLGFQGVETQAIAGIGVHRLNFESDYFATNNFYKSLFDLAFPEIELSERYSNITAGLAIAAFERTVLANNAPFQKWLKGDKSALSKEQKEGALLFFGKANCYSCHSGPALSSMSFHALGMNDFTDSAIFGEVDQATKEGRGGFTGDANDLYAFKTPTIYNLKGLNFLGHGGSFNSVNEVIQYKNQAVAQNSIVTESQLSPLFIPLELSQEEISLLTLFVEDALYDASLDRFVPTELPSGLCFPVADPLSKSDLGCE